MSSGNIVRTSTQDDSTGSGVSIGVRFPHRSYNDDWTRTLDAFQTLTTLGEGTFGWVQKARDRKTGEIVALKKIKMENETEGFPITAIREIKILKTLRDRLKTDHVVILKEVVAAPERDMNSDDKGSIYLVFEYLEHDLAGLMDLRYDTMFRMESIKCFMKQLLEGLYALHHNKIIHRDIKASNLLVNNEGILKIADFGLARPHLDEPWQYTANVITLWYRPPEVLLATEAKRSTVVYSTYVDMWSAGCILAEMLFRAPLFKGKTETELIECIYKVLGTPTKETHPELWPPRVQATSAPSQQTQGNASSNSSSHTATEQVQERPRCSAYDIWRHWKTPAVIHPPKLKQMCEEHKLPQTTYELLASLLSYDPEKRLTAKIALDHDWFWEDPLPCQPSQIGSCPPSNELLAKKQKEEDRRRAAMQHHNRSGNSKPVTAPNAHAANQGHAHPNPHHHPHQTHGHHQSTQHHPGPGGSHQNSSSHSSSHSHHNPHNPHNKPNAPYNHSSLSNNPAKSTASSSSVAPQSRPTSSAMPKYPPNMPTHLIPPHHRAKYAAAAAAAAAASNQGPKTPAARPPGALSASPHPPGAKPPPPTSALPPPKPSPPPASSYQPHSPNPPHSNHTMHHPQPHGPQRSSQAPSAAKDGSVAHYPPSGSFQHNADNPNKRYKTGETSLPPSNGAH